MKLFNLFKSQATETINTVQIETPEVIWRRVKFAGVFMYATDNFAMAIDAKVNDMPVWYTGKEACELYNTQKRDGVNVTYSGFACFE